MLMQPEQKEPLQQIAEAPPPEQTRSRSKVILALLGVTLPLIAGSMVWWPWGVGDIFDNGWVLGTVALAMVLVGISGPCMLYLTFRTWWAALLSPLAWLVGEFVGAGVLTLVEGDAEHFWNAELTIFGIVVWPLLFCLAVGVLAGMGLETWMRQRANGRAMRHARNG